MGRNSKTKRDLKKKRKNNKNNTRITEFGLPNINSSSLSTLFDRATPRNDNLPNIKKELVTIFSEYNPLDAFLSLSVSELWLPNISSQVKHTLAINILLSLEESIFSNHKEIGTYQQFTEFLKLVYEHLPTMVQLEDYIPEQDWGEIKVSWGEETYKIFYGGSVELIPDYINAFELRYSSYPDILVQMKNVLILQDISISYVDKKIVNSKKNISAGHLEIPTEIFWGKCRNMLMKVSENFQKISSNMDKEFIKKLGEINEISSFNTLAEVISTGVAIPAIGININDRIYPVSFRNMANVIIEHYAEQNIKTEFSNSLSRFISQRFDNISGKPFHLFGDKLLPYRFSGILEYANKFYLFALFDPEQPEYLISLTENVAELLSTGEWHLICSTSKVISIQNNLGKHPEINDIEFIFVSSHFSTAGCSFIPPNLKYKHRLIFLPNFISLFDSINDLEELSSFFTYLDKNNKKLASPFLSIIDKFASFRESNSVLEEGAISFNMIMLDPHWGSNWRYDELKEYWSKVPKNFPTYNSKWKWDSCYQENICLIAKNHFGVSWSTEINGCTIHFYANCESLLQEDPLNGQLLTLFLECMCDALSQRKNILTNIEFLNLKKITVHCLSDKGYLVNSDSEITESIPKELFIHSDLINLSDSSIDLRVSLNLPFIKCQLNKPKDASFQAEICITFFKLLETFLSIQFPLEVEQQIKKTKNLKPRMMISDVELLFDSLKQKPNIPEPKHYKLARKTLANLIKDNGILEGKYELQNAKSIINSIASSFREKIHSKISSINKNILLLFIVENYDACVYEDYLNRTHLELSLKHEVNYDRATRLAEQSKEFNRIAGDFRYLLECTLNLDSKSEVKPTTDEMLQMIADVDWLLVLYGASDTLYNDIDVGGITIDEFYIPEVFFSENREIKEKQFSEEQASYQLGSNLNSHDEVEPNILNEKLGQLDQAFQEDLGFKYSNLLASFHMLFKWASINQSQLSLSYQITKAELVHALIQNCKNLSLDEAEKIIKFLTLDPKQIRKLLGSESEYFDVPISDHNKRAHRYNIRPLIELNDDKIIWSAAGAYRASNVWISHIANGYLPAEFEWNHVKLEVRKIKEQIEKQLEITTFNIIKRFTSFAELGIDFRRRFPKEKFLDVGDFDTLAYFPDKNIWLNIECKYNQPYYCIKDMRRLREKIFGKGEQRGQIGKIEKRINFLTNNYTKMCSLLNWESPSNEQPVKIINLYISRQIYWWLRYPPYEIDINFVQVDALDAWLKQNL